MHLVWIRDLCALYVLLSVAASLWVLADIYWTGRRQMMAVMEAVWPLTMLYWGPLGLIWYYWFGQAGRDQRRLPMWQSVFKGATHCGAGCALGDFIGEWVAFGAGVTIFGSALTGKILCGFVLAYLFGLIFQYASVAPMQGLGFRDGLVAAVRIDTLSLLAYEVGMFAWMAVIARWFPDLEPTQWAYWFLMQVAMVVGFLTTYPVNWWLIRRGIKEAM